MSIAEQLRNEGMDLGRPEGIDLGKREGLIEQVRFLREVLGVEGSASELEERSTPELAGLVAELRARFSLRRK